MNSSQARLWVQIGRLHSKIRFRACSNRLLARLPLFFVVVDP